MVLPMQPDSPLNGECINQKGTEGNAKRLVHKAGQRGGCVIVRLRVLWTKHLNNVDDAHLRGRKAAPCMNINTHDTYTHIHTRIIPFVSSMAQPSMYAHKLISMDLDRS